MIRRLLDLLTALSLPVVAAAVPTLFVWVWLDPTRDYEALPWVGVPALCVCAAMALRFVHADLGRTDRRERGLCPSCGYDLRATPGKCPECGTDTSVSMKV